jgi:phage baseplate assembly protein W
MADIPHFAIPFRIDGARGAIVNEQDSDEEITDCAETVLRYEIGQRPERPEFGIPDQTFAEPEPDVSLIQEALVRWEPRTNLIVGESVVDTIDELITKIRVEAAHE